MSARRPDGTIDPSKIVPPEIATHSEKVTPKVKFEFNPFNNVKLDFSTSCTKEEAIAKMLGWLRGAIRLSSDEINIHHITIDQMPFLPELYYSLEDHLSMFRESALDQVAQAFEESTPSEQLQKEALDALLACEDLIIKASAYISALDDELLKGEASELRVDQVKTESTGEIYITLKSLDEWARKNYQISIIDNQTPVNWDIKAISQNAPKQSKEYSDNNGLSKTKAENLYTTFAFLVEAFSETATKYRNGEKINFSALADALAERAAKENHGITLQGQGSETIKSIIERSMDEKKKKLPIK